MVGLLFVRIGVAKQVAVMPGLRGDLQSKRQAAGIKAARHDDGGNAEDVDPRRVGVRASADIAGLALLRHGLIRRRHLGRGIGEAVQMKSG
jgi:hypothetical protein